MFVYVLLNTSFKHERSWIKKEKNLSTQAYVIEREKQSAEK